MTNTLDLPIALRYVRDVLPYMLPKNDTVPRLLITKLWHANMIVYGAVYAHCVYGRWIPAGIVQGDDTSISSHTITMYKKEKK